MSEIESGLYAIHVDRMVEMLSKAYISLVETKTPFKKFPSVMLWGPPGVGKSQGVREIAETIETRTSKRVAITDVRLLLFNPVDLRGIPTANEDKTLAVWLKPKIFQMDDSDQTINILFLDEISAAPPSVQSAAYQIALDRTIGEHKLPDNCIVIAAGNRVTDKSVAYNMPKALANRLCHFEIRGDSASWHNWAVKNGVHEFVVGYLEYNPSALMRFDPTGTGLAFPTPRSWEMVSNILNTVSDDPESVYPMIVGCIGHSAAGNFRTWTELYQTMPPVEDIFAGKETAVPKAPELLIALRSAMTAYARKHPDKRLIDHSVDYACKLPWAFRGKLLHDYCCIPEVCPIIRENDVFKTAMRNEQK
ncbi:MAG: MoxR family ATPase [Firmicutes bacterium]|nr:MoxR family ATPase [Bacillota bacterium]